MEGEDGDIGDTASVDKSPMGPVFVGEHDFRFGAGLGIFGNSKDVGAVFSGYALLQWDALEAGVSGHIGGAALDYDLAGGGFLAGLGATTRWGLRGDVLGELGLEHYSGVDNGEFFLPNGDPGASATLPYAGVRAGLSYQFARRSRSHFELALWGIYQDDLTRENVAYTYVVSSQDSWTHTPYTSQADHTVGSPRLIGLLAVGGSFDL
jgi:hypothetical protein